MPTAGPNDHPLDLPLDEYIRQYVPESQFKKSFLKRISWFTPPAKFPVVRDLKHDQEFLRFRNLGNKFLGEIKNALQIHGHHVYEKKIKLSQRARWALVRVHIDLDSPTAKAEAKEAVKSGKLELLKGCGPKIISEIKRWGNSKD